MPQDAVEAFFNAHEALGRLVELPTSQVAATEPDEAVSVWPAVLLGESNRGGRR